MYNETKMVGMGLKGETQYIGKNNTIAAKYHGIDKLFNQYHAKGVLMIVSSSFCSGKLNAFDTYQAFLRKIYFRYVTHMMHCMPIGIDKRVKDGLKICSNRKLLAVLFQTYAAYLNYNLINNY